MQTRKCTNSGSGRSAVFDRPKLIL
ncbi:Protein CBG25837 [Caenorhabditis briggsae]|uniref:Protein CBG25837 n=1 Tax=Caenorhabditis briggsae TaxID=6238 RepID=B6IHA8_CAEBR|nr:Protein CBG25837 [Caenorhabditis briggsae]CAR99288.1 Protein CBG25837 [Caenorhabditis briggsae]